MKSLLIWDIMLYNPIKVNRSFGRTGQFHLQGGRTIKVINQMKQVAPLHGVMSQKKEVLVTKDVRISDP
jgi:hypothetical protein